MSANLVTAQPSPALQPREVISNMMTALHRSNIDRRYPRFGCEVALRFLAPTNPASRATPEKFASYLSQTWYQPLLNWGQFRWEGELTLLGQNEAYQQISVRPAPDEPWVSVRWILVRVPYYATTDMWMVQSVFVQEPDGVETIPQAAGLTGSVTSSAAANVLDASDSAADVVLKVMNALRHLDEPYPLHGCEVAIRHCSPSNRASRLTPQSFAQYLSEPWYRIMGEWDELELDDEPEVSPIGSLSSDKPSCPAALLTCGLPAQLPC